MKPYAPANYTFEDAAHLLRRMGFGGTPSQIAGIVPTISTSPAAISSRITAGVINAGRPVVKTYAVRPLPSFDGGAAASYLSTQNPILNNSVFVSKSAT